MKKRRTRLSRISRQLEQLELAQHALALASRELVARGSSQLENSQLVLTYLIDALEDLEASAVAPKAAAILKDALSLGWGVVRVVPSGALDVRESEVVALESTDDRAQDRCIARVFRPAVYLNHRAQPQLLRCARVSVYTLSD